MLSNILKETMRRGLHMSWAAHNPEKYEELMFEGVARKLMKELDAMYPDHAITEDQVRMVVGAQWGSKLDQALMTWARVDIQEEEAQYWANLADSVRGRV